MSYWDKYNELLQMFFEPAIDYANSIEAITFETDAEIQAQQERWDKIHKAYGRGVKDVIEYMLANYKILPKEFTEKDSMYCQCPEPDRDTGYIYCQRCYKNVSDARMRFLTGKDEMFLMPAKEEDLEELQRKRLRDSYEYNDMCARATLHPGKSIDEVKHIQLEKRIEDTYKFVNELLLNTKPMNTPETRKYVVELIQKRIDHQVIVRCNEENNSPEIIDSNLLIAELLWNVPYDSKGPQILKSVLVFGDKVAVENYNFQNFLDNETFKFIQKGI